MVTTIETGPGRVYLPVSNTVDGTMQHPLLLDSPSTSPKSSSSHVAQLYSLGIEEVFEETPNHPPRFPVDETQTPSTDPRTRTGVVSPLKTLHLPPPHPNRRSWDSLDPTRSRSHPSHSPPPPSTPVRDPSPGPEDTSGVGWYRQTWVGTTGGGRAPDQRPRHG